MHILLFWWVNYDLLDICALHIEPVPQPSYRNRITSSFLQRQHQRSTQDDALVGVSLVECLHILGVPIYDHASDPTQLPATADSVW